MDLTEYEAAVSPLMDAVVKDIESMIAKGEDPDKAHALMVERINEIAAKHWKSE